MAFPSPSSYMLWTLCSYRRIVTYWLIRRIFLPLMRSVLSPLHRIAAGRLRVKLFVAKLFHVGGRFFPRYFYIYFPRNPLFTDVNKLFRHGFSPLKYPCLMSLFYYRYKISAEYFIVVSILASNVICNNRVIIRIYQAKSYCIEVFQLHDIPSRSYCSYCCI